MQISKGPKNAVIKKMVYKLLKALYGLKQALRLWYKHPLHFFLNKLGLHYINVNYSVFITTTSINDFIVSKFMDNIKVMGVKNIGAIE